MNENQECVAVLPPLPDAQYGYGLGNQGRYYTAEQMHAYARAAIAQAVEIDAKTAQDIFTRYLANDPGDHWPPERAGRLRVEAMQMAVNNSLAARAASSTTPVSSTQAGDDLLAMAKAMRDNYVVGLLIGTSAQKDWDCCGPGEHLHWVLKAYERLASSTTPVVDDAMVERACEAMFPTWRSPDDPDRMRAALQAALADAQGGDRLTMKRSDGSSCCGGYGIDGNGRAVCYDCKPEAASSTTPAEAASSTQADSTCPDCGAPCRKEVLMRGGDNGWGGDASRTVYRYAASSTTPVSMPEGMVLVPREPTPEMLVAGARCRTSPTRDFNTDDTLAPEYRAMLAALADAQGERQGKDVAK